MECALVSSIGQFLKVKLHASKLPATVSSSTQILLPGKIAVSNHNELSSAKPADHLLKRVNPTMLDPKRLNTIQTSQIHTGLTKRYNICSQQGPL
ncbi:MAG: hypothetical protein A6F71_10040 [Cycloclasticus sp. symbiont of Poecilosclerida sp. M]|nr:MAG: hypothetical protein A6F71_10040 [Cycloclasticus sp. symbiont of Poecilosclerida sp. M]